MSKTMSLKNVEQHVPSMLTFVAPHTLRSSSGLELGLFTRQRSPPSTPPRSIFRNQPSWRVESESRRGLVVVQTSQRPLLRFDRASKEGLEGRCQTLGRIKQPCCCYIMASGHDKGVGALGAIVRASLQTPVALRGSSGKKSWSSSPARRRFIESPMRISPAMDNCRSNFRTRQSARPPHLLILLLVIPMIASPPCRYVACPSDVGSRSVGKHFPFSLDTATRFESRSVFVVRFEGV
ncbi:uncharacterized protein LY79DRAFT_258301 [Colletotrichum navitas]|uniref:Uncharacterized protein n=1 Tax=Colletotrichum navitas TaxID=681940 RepID=A0AAD8PWN6_9PEZI|nr:uncharacterized protein LY79DRAFT_258301 [Colletotrichum navitas]KAK1585882.1 hypothetical protein LY79DRAFT_258301 [Colletotrichum navitas]